MKKKFILLLCFFFSLVTYSQNLDSLLTVARQTKNDSVKIRMYNKIAFGYIFNNTDMALKVLNEGKESAKAAGFNFGLTELVNTYGIYMDVTGKSDSAAYYFEKALTMSRDFGFKNIESMCINNLGMFNWNRGNYDEALDYFFQSLKMDEAQQSEKSTSTSLNNIGLIYQEMNLNGKALEYHKKALKVREKYNLENEQIASHNNIGINLKDLGRIDEAILSYKKGLALAKKLDNRIEYYKILDNLANAYYDKGNKDLALETYLEALKKKENYNGDERGMLSTYNNIATLYNEKSLPKIAKHYVGEGFNLVKKYPEIELVSADLYLTLAESNYMLGNYDKARQQKRTYIKLKDSIFSEKNAQKIADLEVKYETEKKEKEILIQRAELAEQDLVIQKRNYQLYGLALLTLILGLVGFLFYNQQKLKNHQLQKENELKDALIKIETQNKLQEQRLRISRDLHDNIGAQLTFIISSIDNLKYGFDIKDEKLTHKLKTISDFTSGTIYELRDTIWAMNKDKITFEDLQIRISNFIDHANLAAQNIKFNFNVEDSVDNTMAFSSVKGMNIYRIIQEAINNAVKYADASTINVNLSKIDNKMFISIKDNGKGFDENNVKLGNGINNMKKRADDINAQFAIQSSINEGTDIILQV
ncbi:tetratricopeptide repeat-containing sensor histidine kinase [Winogradskyella algicola]|uniref:tetratricopeptide repeat-containing sensor histidine kinase n=1 Tax=Winogradskyella algicola TaxID=2575815 RepID=UPI0014872F00|nr:tetratricopeptide repeat protein [Winogradskyella algicola]